MRRILVFRSRDVDEPWRCIDQPDFITKFREPERVSAACAADVEHDRRRLRGVTQNELTRAKLLQAKRSDLEARFFRSLLVVRTDVCVEARRSRFCHLLNASSITACTASDACHSALGSTVAPAAISCRATSAWSALGFPQLSDPCAVQPSGVPLYIRSRASINARPLGYA